MFVVEHVIVEQIYDYVDRPLLFLARDPDRRFLVVNVEETETTTTWLYVVVSDQRVRDLQAGLIDLHDGFAKPEDDEVYVVSELNSSGEVVSRTARSAQTIPPEWLPDPGERL